MSVFTLHQRYFDIPKVIRQNINLLILFRVACGLKYILREIDDIIDKKEYKNMTDKLKGGHYCIIDFMKTK
jgi:hypothetical protein